MMMPIAVTAHLLHLSAYIGPIHFSICDMYFQESHMYEDVLQALQTSHLSLRSAHDHLHAIENSQ